MIVTRDEQVRQAIRRATAMAADRGTSIVVCELVKRDGSLSHKTLSETMVESLCRSWSFPLRQTAVVHSDGLVVRLSR